LSDEYSYLVSIPDLELARLRQTEADLESLAKYRRLKLEAYDSWSKSMGKEFTYYNKDGTLEKVDVEAKRAEAAATQDSMAGMEIGPQHSVRKAYKDYLESPGGGPALSLSSPLRWTPVPPPVALSRFDKVCLWFQSLIRRIT